MMENFHVEILTAYVDCFMQTVSSVEWHRKGDYLSAVMPADILFPESYLFSFSFSP